MIWRCVVLTVFLALMAGEVHAQAFRVYGPEGVALTVVPGPDPNVESITAQLSDALANFDNSGIDVREGLVREGEIIATRALPYEGVARLSNEVTRAGALTGRMLVLPAGTPLYRHEFINADAIVFNGSARVRGIWCGVHERRGYCFIQRRTGWEAAQIQSGSPYAPSALGPFVPVSAPQMVFESEVMRQLPERIEVYRLKGRSVARFIRVGGDEVEMGDAPGRRMRLGSIMVHRTAGPEPGSVMVRAEPLDPAEHQSELRALARGILSGVRASRP